MEDFIYPPILLAFAAGLQGAIRNRHDPAEVPYLDASFAAHCFSSFAQIWIYTYWYPGGDVLAYHHFGLPIADALRNDFSVFFEDTVAIFFHGESRLPFLVLGGGSTGTMSMIAVWLMFLFGNSVYAASLAVAVGSYWAKLLVFRALRPEVPAEHRRALIVALMLVPSAVFWTATLLKEPVMMVFFGPLFYGLRLVIDGRRLWLGTLLLVVGAGGVALIKPYVLFAFAIAGGLWLIWNRVLRGGGGFAVRPMYLAAGLVAIAGASTVLDRFLPKGGDAQSLSQQLAFQRRAALTDEGGSNFSLEGARRDAADTEGTSSSAQLALAPLALVTALFRPFIFEARNPMQVLNALETTWLLYLVVQLIRRYSLAALVRSILDSPPLMFCAAFTLILALGTGLSTSNMGTLSRYRAPMMPFFVSLMLLLRARHRSGQPQGQAAGLNASSAPVEA